MSRLSGRVVVVTGAAAGIGRALAFDLAARGARLAISDVDAGGLAATARHARTLGARVHEQVLDVTDRVGMQRYADAVVAAYGAVHVLVNNAGVAFVGEFHLPRPVVVATSALTYRVSLERRLPVAVQRRLAAAGTAVLRAPRGTHTEALTLGGRPAQRVSVGASERPRVIVYLHGGGYVLGSPWMYRALTGRLAVAAGAVVYAPDYRLAPEHPYPAALDDAVAAVRELVDVHGVAPSRIALAGDSAGGGLAVATARLLTDAGLRPGALALLSPWTDPSDLDMPARDFVAHRDWGRGCAARYRAGADHRDPGYAPMYADLTDLPPMLIHVARGELLHEQVLAFAVTARQAGVDVRMVELDGLWHSAHLLAGTLRAASDAADGVGAFLRTRLDRAAPPLGAPAGSG